MGSLIIVMAKRKDVADRLVRRKCEELCIEFDDMTVEVVQAECPMVIYSYDGDY
jgi:hypothetical protein|tara:strand:- start:622 stop:783 length:162 start_codon:yes stop_codon:yes gene_type:complete